jgi:hypothetical protein
LLTGIEEGLGQGLNFGFGAFDDMEGKALGCFGANAGKSLELLD